MSELSLAAAIIAVISFIKTLPIGDAIKGWVTIAIAAILGLLAGLANFQGLTWFTGLLSGLMAVGAMTTAQNIGVKSEPPQVG